MINTHPIFKEIGHLLTPVSFCFLFPIIVSIIYNEYFDILPFAFIFVILFTIGITINLKTKKNEEPLRLRDSLAMIFMLWVLITLLGAIPFMWIEHMTLLDAFFESVSSWTTTGFSLMNVEQTSHTILFWRSFGQWIGGLGIIVFALTNILRVANTSYMAEGRNERIMPNILSTLKAIWILYAAFTVIGATALFLLGMPVFDSILHSMSAMATGGMSTQNASIGYYHSFWIEVVIVILMLLGTLSFKSHYDLLRGKFKDFISDIENITLFIVMVISLSLLFFNQKIWTSVFHAVSAISSTGYQIEDISGWKPTALMILTILMLIGGAAGSTAGGLKLIRLGVLFKTLINNIRSIFFPQRIFSKRIGDKQYNDEEILDIFKFTLLYICLFFICSMILMYNGYTEMQSIFTSASAIGNSGLSIITNYTITAKVVMIFEMLAGRLEIWCMLIFAAYLFKGRF